LCKCACAYTQVYSTLFAEIIGIVIWDENMQPKLAIDCKMKYTIYCIRAIPPGACEYREAAEM